MASKDQFEFFQAIYEEENGRYDELESRAKLYLSVVAVFVAALLLKAQEVSLSAKALGVPWVLVLLEAALLAGSLLFTVLGSLIRTYEGLCDPEEIVRSFGASRPSDEEFFDDRIVDFAVATNRNSAVNDRTARYLAVAGVLLSASMFLLIGLFVAALFAHAEAR